MTTLPTWALGLVAIGTPASALVGVLLSQWIARRGARELDSRGRREEAMRTLRWASELAVDVHDEQRADLGAAQLVALLRSDLLDPAEQMFVTATLGVVYRDPLALDGVLDGSTRDDPAPDAREDRGPGRTYPGISTPSEEDRER